MSRENKTFAKLLFRYGDKYKDLVQVVTWPLAVLHRANFSTDPSFWGRLTETEVDISKNIVGGFCQTDFESGVYQLRGRLQELLEMSAVNYTLIGQGTTRSFSHWLGWLQILFKRTTSKTVSTWETFSVTCHYVSYIGHRKANFYLPLLTFQGATLYCLHCWLLEIYNDVMTDPHTTSWWWFSMLQFLTTLKISSCRWSQWFVFWARLSPLLHASLLILARMFFNGSCWFWTLKMLRTTWNPI